LDDWRELAVTVTTYVERDLQLHARVIARRTDQLAKIARMIVTRQIPVDAGAISAGAVHRALVESALLNGRELVGFLTESGDGPGTESYGVPRDVELIKLASDGNAAETISRRLSRGDIILNGGGSPTAAWPIPELANVLVGRMARFILVLQGVRLPRARWFAPPPLETERELLFATRHGEATEVSSSPDIALLTRALQEYIAGR
jgi:hypothetical protein